jgi:hypothetical protein
MIVKQLSAVVVTLVLGFGLGCCSPFAGYVADSWPHFAGGEPADMPPRQGTPGYAAFIAHGQPSPPPAMSTASVPPAAPVAGALGAPAPNAPAVAPGHRSIAVEQQPVAPEARPAAPNESVIRGGLY